MTSTIDMNLFIQALLVNGIIAVIAYFAKVVSKSGILGGLIVGIPIYAFMGWQGFVILFSMFAIGTLATKWGYQKKKEMGLAEKNEGQRGISNVLGKCLAGVIFAVCSSFFPKNNAFFLVFRLAFLGSFAAGAFDTISSELGQLYGKKCYTLIPFRKVEKGTEGAVSLEGTVAGILGGTSIVLIGLIIGLFLVLENDYQRILFGVMALVGILLGITLSNIIESVLGSKFESKKLLNKFTTNFLNTFLGGVLSALSFFTIFYIYFFIWFKVLKLPD